MKRLQKIAILWMLTLLMGCAAHTSTAPPTGTPPPNGVFISPTAPAAPIGTPVASVSTAITLRVWLPPEFDPSAETFAAEIFRARLEAFERLRPNVQVEVRIKALEGDAGMLNMLTATSAVAPLAMPHLVLLPRHTLEAVVLKGLATPFEDVLSGTERFYPFARQLGQVQGTLYGLPMAADVLTLVYRPAQVPQPPANWEMLKQTPSALLFSAASPQNLFVLAQYQAAGGALQDDMGRPLLDSTVLSTTLSALTDVHFGGQFPFWLTQYENNAQVWQAYQEGRASMAVVWLSQYLKTPLSDSALAALPIAQGEPFTLANGWLWALTVTTPSEQQTTAAELAGFLTLPEFSGQWAQAYGYLPVEAAALENWGNPAARAFVSQAALTAHPLPPTDVLTSLGPLFQNATIQLLKEQAAIEQVVEQTMQKILEP
ncbi:MAG: hypothetical protein OHK0052_10480 [Anaerolineales bacterium]